MQTSCRIHSKKQRRKWCGEWNPGAASQPTPPPWRQGTGGNDWHQPYKFCFEIRSRTRPRVQKAPWKKGSGADRREVTGTARFQCAPEIKQIVTLGSAGTQRNVTLRPDNGLWIMHEVACQVGRPVSAEQLEGVKKTWSWAISEEKLVFIPFLGSPDTRSKAVLQHIRGGPVPFEVWIFIFKVSFLFTKWLMYTLTKGTVVHILKSFINLSPKNVHTWLICHFQILYSLCL